MRVIFLYHSVGNSIPFSVPERDFRRQLAFLLERFRLVRLCELPQYVTDECHSVACLTFDDGYLDNYQRVLPVLERFGIRATFFLVPSYLGKHFRTFYGQLPLMSASQVRELVALGHEVGAHTMTHPKLTHVTHEQARHEIAESKRALEDLLGVPVVSFAYPKGDYNEAVKGLVQDAGFRYATTIQEACVSGVPDWLALPRVSVNATMGMVQLRLKLSPALGLYERLRGRRE
jgi:peptidoglycan/xylan/chitin deacetylase (PgdA/CDA1 family)